MESKKSRRKRMRWIIVLGLLLLVFAWWWKGGLDRVKAATTSGRDRAQALVAAYAKHVGAHDAVHQTLDENNDRSFGDFGFHYFPDKDVLQARVYIVRSHLKDWPDRAVYERRVDAGLNEAKFGGMYDRGGGYFYDDEDKQILFLMKDYKLSETSGSEFIKDVDNLIGLSGLWVTSWMHHAANQILGHEPPPTQRITRENDPYKRQ
jgi:hypothetical protein